MNRELSAYAYRMLGGYQDAEDALQETRLKAWRQLGSYAPTASFRAWVYRITTNACLDIAPGHPATLEPAAEQTWPSTTRDE